MESKVNYLLVGLFVLVLSLAGVTAVLWLSVGGFYQTLDRYWVYTDESVAGLGVDAQVSYLGVEVGRVADIVIDPEVPERVQILLEVEPQTPVRSDTKAMLRMQGLTGLLTVDLIGTSAAGEPVPARAEPPYPVITSEPSLMAHLEENASELLFELKETAKRMNRLMAEENLAKVAAILEHMETLTGGVAGETGALRQALVDFSALVGNTRAASEALPPLAEQLPELAGQFRRAAGSLERMAGELARTGKLLNDSIEASAGDVRRFTRDTLPEAAALVDELYQAARNFRQLSERLEQNPSSIIFGGPDPRPGPGEERRSR